MLTISNVKFFYLTIIALFIGLNISAQSLFNSEAPHFSLKSSFNVKSLFAESDTYSLLSPNSADRKGFKTHTFYWGLGVNRLTGINSNAPTGFATKIGSIFYVFKPGFANGLLNVGLDVCWLNIESVGMMRVIADDGWGYARVSQNYGPVLTANISGDLYADLYYRIGWGFGMYYDADDDFIFPDIARVSSIGANLRYKMLYVNIGTNGSIWTNSFQFMVGLCGHIK